MKTRTLIFLGALGVGVAVALRHSAGPNTRATSSPINITPVQTASSGSLPPSLHDVPLLPIPSVSRASVESWVKAGSFEIRGFDGQPRMQMAVTADGCAMWLTAIGQRASLQAGVHSNGYPMLLVSDGAIRNFGLGRVDGANASPILVFRNNDVVKMVFGLHMSDAGRPPFLVTYGVDGKKTDVIGRY